MKESIDWLWFGGQTRSLLCAFLLVLTMFAPVAVAQQNDRAPVTVRRPAAGRLEDYRSSREYRYDREARPPDNPLGRFFNWLSRKIGSFLTSKSYQNFWQYVFLAGVAALVIWLLIKANIMGNLFSRPARSSPLTYAAVTENIHEINFTERIEEALEQRNYRLAVRLLYLQTLKRLTDNGLIRWQPNKTNRQYAYELTGNPARLGFEQLTTHFEYVWYGDFPVDETRFNSIRQAFTQFNAS